jgi:hypothetical protein
MSVFHELLPLILLLIMIGVPLAIVIYSVRRMRRRAETDKTSSSKILPKGES